MEFRNFKDRNNFIHYFKFIGLPSLAGNWVEIVNVQTDMRISTDGSKGNSISH